MAESYGCCKYAGMKHISISASILRKAWISCLLITGLFISCTSEKSETSIEIPEPIDHHTFAKPNEARTTHLDLTLSIDFEQRRINGIAKYQIATALAAEEIVLDTRDLAIDSVWIVNDGLVQEGNYDLETRKPHLGSALHISIDSTTTEVVIKYQTSAEAAALQWLDPQQTQGKRMPFLFTQGQAILSRTWIPCQDGPGIRFTYDATVKVPSGMLALMSAKNPQEKSQDGTYTFQMPQPIPAYLMALAVGDIEFKPIGARTGVYAEPGMLDQAANEFADLEKMVVAAEEMYGPYLWERYDLIVLPPSFPFGGMENPRLTFATPTIIAGDRSLTSLVAHELAHSWSGNLVTNATWEDFWINEGHTVYLERRIMEKLYGQPYVDMLALLGLQDLEKTVDDLGTEHPDTKLKLALINRDPDEGMTDIAYEKGYLLLRTLEDTVGRQVFDEFLHKYFSDHEFKSISTEAWKYYCQQNLLEPNDIEFDLDAWLYQPGIPAEHATIVSDKFKRVNYRVREFKRIARLDRSNTRAWSTHEWLHFIRSLPTSLDPTFYQKLDRVYELSNSGNAEILAAWLELSIRSGYFENHHQDILRKFLVEVGRRKFLLPLYRALVETGKVDLAKNIFEQAKNNYHSLSANSVAEILKEYPSI